MPSKRKRDILEGFDPNKSDSEDENFDPTEDRPRRSHKKSRSSRPKGSRKRSNRYRGSDIEDDDELSDSEQEDSFGEEEEEEEEDEDLPVNATGRRMRKAAAKQQSYKESSDDDASVIKDSDDGEDEVEEIAKPPSRPSRIVVLKTNPRAQRASKRGKEEPAPHPPPMRRTRARTEEVEEPLVELSNSGRHAQPARASRSKSPEAMARATRATRGGKGVKKLPDPIEEATQESEPKDEPDQPMDEPGEPNELALTKHEDEPENRSDQDDGVLAEEAAEDAAMEDQQEPPAPAEDAPADEEEEDDDDAPITRRTRATRGNAAAPAAPEAEPESPTGRRRLTRKSRLRSGKSLQEPSSDFEPGDESGEGEGSGSEASKNGDGNADAESTPTPRGRGSRAQSRRSRRNRHDSGDEEIELDKDEMAEELEELRESSRSRPRRGRRRSPSIQYEERATTKRRTKPVNYSIPAIDAAALEIEEDDDEPTTTPARNRRGGKGASGLVWERNLNTTYGPFGGGGGAGSLLGGPWGTGATGGVDSDSSDDEMVQRSGIGGTVGMTPTSAAPPVGLFNPMGQTHNVDGIGGIGAATPQVGKVKNQKAFADADPLGVDMSVDFSKVGGLQGHIDQLKEMVQLPLLYPELFLKFHVTPPRGVLFHGPPGTGKTLLARALANSVGSGGRKISFYMRKGADALSKWVGEAEKQLRLLFEEARRTQPSIIFFDEIDGLAPVRSSKQEQIHASIVSTLLALMDGMDGRGQVIVIGATNRPDNIDPALRRPGRFDREFYFPLPDLEGRRSIIDIHTKDWGISDEFKDALAENTKGYGGADLRALCTEAALNAIQRTYPQIYTSKEKLVVDPDKITIHASDFMISVKKMIPSSERSTSSSAIPLPRSVEPLLRNQFRAILKVLDNILPRPKKTTALQEAMYEPYEDADHGFGREAMHQEFERSRIFRPRLLISGVPGMGQNYLASAILHHLEGVHVQTMDLATLLGDGRPLEQVIVSRFTEVKRHKPSVIFIPGVDIWWNSIGDTAITTFTTLLRSIAPSDPVLLLATAECTPELLAPEILKELFGFSKRNRAVVERPERENRLEFFENIVRHLRKSPTEFPDPVNRKKRILEDLPVAPPPPPKTLTKEEIKAQRKADLHHLNLLKMRLQPIMDQIHRKYRKFRQPVIPLSQIAYLFDESDPNFVRPDLAEGEQRPYEIARDKEGTEGIREVATGKFFYNLESTTIEERLANGYYARPIDFYKDINRLYLDAKNIGDRDRTLKANELRTNVEVDVHEIAQTLANQGIRFEEIYQRQLQRAKEAEEKARKRKALQPVVDLIQSDIPGDGDSDSQGPVGIGLPLTRDMRTTGARFQPIMSPPSNGHPDTTDSHPATNGTSVPSRRDGDDVHMGGVDDDTQPMFGHRADLVSPLQWPRPPLGDSTRATAGTQLSQRSVITSIPPGVSPSAILNDASTTKTSELSTNRGSGNWSTQQTNGMANNAEGASQLVDTQDQSIHQSGHSGPSQAPSSQRDWAHSQADAMAKGILQPRHGMGMHPGVSGAAASLISEESSPPSSQRPSQRKPATALDNILNDADNNASLSGSNSSGPGAPTPGSGASKAGTGPGGASASSHSHSNSNSHFNTLASLRQSASASRSGGSASSSQQPVIHEGKVDEFWQGLADRTAGCSVEQLEQIYRELMDEIWRTRDQWNRMTVLSRMISVFNDTIGDIELVQGMLVDSQKQQGGGGGKDKGKGDGDGDGDAGDGEILESVEGPGSHNVGISQQTGSQSSQSQREEPWVYLGRG
ncbi:TAT-binding protein-like protein 7, AAA ATPase [Madurella fahalii]|uniref:TAT-binding protein-like protein 7, AAA ATPase n=1 Tax=Madurella fahalii TaxID=1157608 RepID=A0ABQ0GSF9_9PEZI